MSADALASRFPLGSQVTTARLSADPYPLLAELRKHEPITWVPETAMWFVTRYDDVHQVLADFRTYRSPFLSGRSVGAPGNPNGDCSASGALAGPRTR